MTKKTRVHELARELEVDWKILRDKGKPLGIDISTHQATISHDEELKIRAALKKDSPATTTSSSAPSSSAAAAAAPAAGGRVVIRRRKAESEDPIAQAAAEQPQPEPEVPAAPRVFAADASSKVVIVPSEPAAPPIVVSTSKSENVIETSTKPAEVVQAPEVVVPVVAKSPVTPIAPTAPIVTTPIVEKSPETEVKAQVSKPSETIVASTPAPASTTQPPDDSALKKKVAIPSGATIVRRASAEEIEAQKQSAAAREASLQANRTSRKEDNRGVRVSGMGLLSRNKPQHGSNPGVYSTQGASPGPNIVVSPDMIPDSSAAEEWQSKKAKPFTREEEEAEERRVQSVKNAKQKRANSGMSMRALLEQFEEPSEDEEVVEEVQSRVFTPSASSKRRDSRRRKDNKKTQITTPRARYKVVEMDGAITVAELSQQMAVKAGDVIKKLMAMGVMATMNQELDVDTATLLASDFGFELKNREVTAEDLISQSKSKTHDQDATQRPPIVTIMGHVDHGKTSLLDAIRSANVASGEAGGITQHIGAYTVDYNNQRIAFLDTPGHEAFSSMRARGASLTDIVILVVAADDGVMPQTVEAINHAKAANVPIIVAVNKIDKPSTNLDRLFAQLAEHGIQSEEWGGENQFVKTSALQRIGIDDLLEAILLQAEILDLKTTATGFAMGAVVEAHLDKGRGPVATIMIQQGTLEVGQYVVAGKEFGRVRGMIDHRGKKVDKAGPSTPVEVIGLAGVPAAGDKVNAVEDEKTCRDIAAIRIETERKKTSGKSSAASLADLLAKVQNSDRPEVPIIIKADVQGSLEAVCEAVGKLESPKVTNRVVHRGVGGITDSDLSLAVATGAVIIGFNVRATRGLDDQADREGVVVKYFSIIYELVDAVKAIMAGKLPPIVTEQVIGHAEVRQTISVPKIGTIAGSAVLDGKITRQSFLRLVRNNVVIYSGKISSLRRFKDDVKEVAQGYECGISIEGYQDVRIGDVIEAFALEETAPTL